MRSIGLDIHRDFCEVAIAEGAEIRSAGRLSMAPEALELFAGSLGQDDQVALEVSGNAWEVARIIRPRVARVGVRRQRNAGVKALDQHVRLGLRQRRTPYWWHAR